MPKEQRKCSKCEKETNCFLKTESGSTEYVDVFNEICPDHGIVDSHRVNSYYGEWTICPFCGESSETHKKS